MTDVSIVIKKLLGGADKSTIQKVAMVIVDAVTKVYGEEYVLVPKTSLGADAKNVKPIKKPKKWGRIIESLIIHPSQLAMLSRVGGQMSTT